MSLETIPQKPSPGPMAAGGSANGGHGRASQGSEAHWSDALRAELADAGSNGRVGQTLVSESDRVRVWLIAMEPGERLPFHTHVLDYFWTATSAGRARSRYADGRVAEVTYAIGDTKHFRFSDGDSMTHDLENIGSTTLCFTTVEYLDGGHRPLPI